MLDNLIKYDFRQQFFDLSQPKMIRDIMANLEAKNSKLFFEIVQKVSGLKKQAIIAKALKANKGIEEIRNELKGLTKEILSFINN